MNRPKKRIWIPSPPTTICWPFFIISRLPPDIRPAPIARRVSAIKNRGEAARGAGEGTNLLLEQ